MTRRVIVIGAGITGVSTAAWLRRASAEVTLVDRVAPGDQTQTSYGNGGILARCAVIPVSVPGLLWKAPRMLLDPHGPLFMRWSYVPRLMPWLIPFLRNGSQKRLGHIVRALQPLTSDAVDQHVALATGTEAAQYIATGDYAYLYPSREAFGNDALGMALRREHGFDFEERGRAALVDVDPDLGEVYNFGAIFRDHGWITDPGAYTAALAAHFVREGGVIQRGEVVDIGDGSVTLDGGETLHADRIVLAAGVWSKKLAEKLGHRVKMESERGYHLELKQTSHRPPYPYMLADAKVVAAPMGDAIRFAGLVEFGGLEADSSPKPIELLRHRAKRLYPQLTWRDEAEWMGHRPSTTDSLPLLGRSARAPKVIFAFGTHHIGMTIGPRLGRMAADLALDRLLNEDITPYAVDRFDGS